VKSEICHGVDQYDRCSTNGNCGCFHMTDAGGSGICGFIEVTCSKLALCNSSNNVCDEPNHVCVRHPRCQSHSVCYPLSMIDQRICPPTTSEINISN